MWDEPFDPSLIGKVDMVIVCHTLKDTIALSKILRSHNVTFVDGSPLGYKLCWGYYHPKKDPIAYRVDRHRHFGWASYEYYEDPESGCAEYRRVTFRTDENLPDLDIPCNTADFLLI